MTTPRVPGSDRDIFTGPEDDAADESKASAQSPALLAAQWARVRERLQHDVGDVDYRTWLRQMSLGAVDGEEVTAYLPTRFLRDWVRGRYCDKLNAAWQMEGCAIRRVDLRVAPQSACAAAESLAPIAPPPPAPVPNGGYATPRSEERADAKNDLAGPLDARFSFEAFVVGKPNEFAYACARRVAEQPANPGFNPLFLYGGVGLGKTHLMHAIGHEFARRNTHAPASVTYMSAEKFMYRFIAAIRSQSTMDFKESLRSADVLMIDDLQFLIGKDNTQEEFFHTFNFLIESKKQIVISADKSPSDLSGLEDRLRTRLGCGMVADLHATTFELRVSILQAKATQAGVDVPRRVLEFLAHKMNTNIRELEGALNRLLAHAEMFSRPITLEMTQEVLHDLLKAHDRRVSIEDIQKRVAEHYNIRMADMSSARRARAVARPRQVAMFLSKHLTSCSLPVIGRKFGNRDHTTVMHAVSRVTEIMGLDAGFAEDVELLRRMLES